MPIPEPEPVVRGLETPFARWAPAVERLGASLPGPLRHRIGAERFLGWLNEQRVGLLARDN